MFINKEMGEIAYSQVWHIVYQREAISYKHSKGFSTHKSNKVVFN